MKPKEVPNSIIFPNSDNAVLVKPLSPPTLINSNTNTATNAPIGSMRIPSHFKTVEISFFNGIFLKIGVITVGPVTMINPENKKDNSQFSSKIKCAKKPAGFLAHFIFELNWELSFLFSGLIIVTGPTVITPILRNIPLKKDISTVLKWEGILIDPIGALVAVLVFEFISVGGDSGFTKTALSEFGKIILFGTSFGFTFAHALTFVINKKWIPHYLLNVVSLSTVLLVFVESEIFAHESGLLAVVVMGMVLGNGKLKNLKELLYFKESLSVLLISILFILLAANINMEDLMLLYNWKQRFFFFL